jgi:transcriptional regulator with XRE-family HTH domain
MMQSPLKEWRGPRTQEEAAKLLGANVMTYSRWERGIHLPRKNKWPVIKEVTGLPLERVLEFVEEVQ